LPFLLFEKKKKGCEPTPLFARENMTLDRRYHQDNGDTHAKQDMQSSIVGGYKV
jgi:hypothetical protein